MNMMTLKCQMSTDGGSYCTLQRNVLCFVQWINYVRIWNESEFLWELIQNTQFYCDSLLRSAWCAKRKTVGNLLSLSIVTTVKAITSVTNTKLHYKDDGEEKNTSRVNIAGLRITYESQGLLFIAQKIISWRHQSNPVHNVLTGCSELHSKQ